MKGLAVTKIGNPAEKTKGTLALMEFSKPEIKNDEDVLIKVCYASICGSDGHLLNGNIGEKKRLMFEKTLPKRFGHEISGIVEAAGAEAAKFGFTPGTRVTANYSKYCGSCYYCRSGKENLCRHPKVPFDGMSEYVVWHMSQVYKLPDDVELMAAALTEPASIALHAVEVAGVKFGSYVAISGGGGIGLMAVQFARMAGAAKVTIIEPVLAKRNLALQLGADNAIDPINDDVEEKAREFTGNMKYDCILECSGATSAAENALKILAFNGNIVYFSMYRENYELPVNLFKYLYSRESNLKGMMISSDGFEKTVRMLHRVNFDPIIQRVYRFEDYEKAFADQLSGKYARIIFDLTDPQN